jgi:hypothetical protein
MEFEITWQEYEHLMRRRKIAQGCCTETNCEFDAASGRKQCVDHLRMARERKVAARARQRAKGS